MCAAATCRIIAAHGADGQRTAGHAAAEAVYGTLSAHSIFRACNGKALVVCGGVHTGGGLNMNDVGIGSSVQRDPRHAVAVTVICCDPEHIVAAGPCDDIRDTGKFVCRTGGVASSVF